jgi:hypothetical protein
MSSWYLMKKYSEAAPRSTAAPNETLAAVAKWRFCSRSSAACWRVEPFGCNCDSSPRKPPAASAAPAAIGVP